MVTHDQAADVITDQSHQVLLLRAVFMLCCAGFLRHLLLIGTEERERACTRLVLRLANSEANDRKRRKIWGRGPLHADVGSAACRGPGRLCTGTVVLNSSSAYSAIRSSKSAMMGRMTGIKISSTY